MNTIEFQSKKIRLVQTKRTKYLRLSVSPQGEIKLTAPLSILQRQLIGFLEKQVDWLNNVLAQLPAVQKLNFESGVTVELAGKTYTLEVNDNYPSEAKVYIDRQQQKIYVLHSQSRGWQTNVSAKLNIAFRALAKSVILEDLPNIAAEMGITYKDVSVREQRSRWGSCSSKGNLNFNWKIILAPTSVMRYVLVHELAHIPQPNHSKYFWNLVAEFHPSHRQDRLWLKRNGHSLEIL